jgi:hypothetical protein
MTLSFIAIPLVVGPADEVKLIGTKLRRQPHVPTI